jgi:hypothetical protein
MPEVANHIHHDAQPAPDIPEAHDSTRWHRAVNFAKRNMAPLAIAAAGVLTVPAALNVDEAAAMQRSHPVFRFRDYNQGDYDSRMATTGCGPTAMSMVIATEANDSRLTPPVIGNELSPDYWVPGSGTLASGFHHVSKHYGVQSKHSNLQKAQDVLWDGGLAIVHAKPGPWTSAGHYLVLKSVRSDGDFRLADPNNAPGRDTEDQWWSASELKAHGVDDVWTFTPSENMF